MLRLRGLNPPHRVKSISMTTFTQQEIEFLQKHSNEVCKHIWLGLYDERSSAVPDFREPQKVKEFLQEKYEKKRWYVPPDQAKLLASVQPPVSGPSASTSSSTPEVQPLKTLQLNKTPSNQSPVVSRSQTQEKKFDLLSDLGGDIFAAPPPHPAAGASGFANFGHFSRSSGGSVSAPPLPTGSGEDRYAALAELDSALSSASQGVFDAVPGSAPVQKPPVLPSIPQGYVASTNPFVASAVPPESMCTNPFQISNRSSASGSMSMPAGFSSTSGFCLPTSFSGNFQLQQQFPPAAYHQQPNGAFPMYGPVKPPVGYGQPAVSNNPFMGGAPAGPYPTGGSSTNPFL
ncbi:arf-GAP domain and FG repeat-containing protein 1b isoform X2 [Trichomycterus rosablanca]|uniref:arf-GAP domain and FG repeat-containing protein 1b isoform X2 n=1 Tax=Trichomycterus rosablanca TaxID=2290929 RepID=UPI002F360A5F